MPYSDSAARAHTVDLARKQLGLDTPQAEDLERGIFNWALQRADSKKIPKQYTNQRFMAVYALKTFSVLANADPTSYIGNSTLLPRIRNGEIKPHDVAFMKPQDSMPDRWKEVIELKVKKDEYAATVRPVAMTSQFRCQRCKKRECVYQEQQLRSADEPASIIVTCIACSNTWRVG